MPYYKLLLMLREWKVADVVDVFVTLMTDVDIVLSGTIHLRKGRNDPTNRNRTE